VATCFRHQPVCCRDNKIFKPTHYLNYQRFDLQHNSGYLAEAKHSSPSLPHMLNYTGVYHSFDTITILPLDITQLQLLLRDNASLLTVLKLPPQELYQPDFLNEITYNVIIPAVTKKPAQWFYYTKWLAVETATGLIVGEFMLKNGIDDKGFVEIGYGIYPAYEGKGLMTQVVSCFIDWARTASILKGIKAETENGNKASIRVLEKNGFVQTAWPGDFTWWQLSLK
jgi:[ribosomal protein S5]-alanine N-acetyltransferase